MFRVFVRRLIWMIPVLFIISVVTFTLMLYFFGARETRGDRELASRL